MLYTLFNREYFFSSFVPQNGLVDIEVFSINYTIKQFKLLF